MSTGSLPTHGPQTLLEAIEVPYAPWVPEPDVCAERVAALSISERHILELLAAGWPPKVIMRLRNISMRTLTNTMSKGYVKLGVSARHEAIAVLQRARLA